MTDRWVAIILIAIACLATAGDSTSHALSLADTSVITAAEARAKSNALAASEVEPAMNAIYAKVRWAASMGYYDTTVLLDESAHPQSFERSITERMSVLGYRVRFLKSALRVPYALNVAW